MPSGSPPAPNFLLTFWVVGGRGGGEGGGGGWLKLRLMWLQGLGQRIWGLAGEEGGFEYGFRVS